MSWVPDRIPPGRIKLTYEDYVELPDDGRRNEILDGELRQFVAARRPRSIQRSSDTQP